MKLPPLSLVFFKMPWGRKLDLILINQEKMMAQIDDLNAALQQATADISTLTSVDQSAIALLNQLKAMLDNVTTAPDLTAAIQAANDIKTAIEQNDTALAAAVAANTPAAPPAPAPAPTPAP